MKLSIVIPLYNERETIVVLYERLAHVLAALTDQWELIIVDDGSKDGSFEALIALHQRDTRVKVLSFSRNFGHQVAVTAGLDIANGDAVIVMDADLQDPPEVITAFVRSWEEGNEVVYGIRRKRKEGLVKRLAYNLFYRFFTWISDTPVPLDAGDFCLMDKVVVEELRRLPERSRFIRGLRSWVGFRQIGIPYERAERSIGKSKYSLAKLFALAFDGIFAFSRAPLRFLSWLGIVLSLLSFLGILIVLYLRLLTDTTVPGFATTIVLILFIGGVQLVSLGIIGEYLGRIYEEVKARPAYVIKKRIGC